MKKLLQSLSCLLLLSSFSHQSFCQCATESDVYSFDYNGKTYEIIKDDKNWKSAASCAVERGGILAEINDQAEQDEIFDRLKNDASINVTNTISVDGGDASYVWIGGNDLKVEGNWVWDGNGDQNGIQFWMGTTSGNAVGNRYTNWGFEPDDYNSNQDALGLAITDWPFGQAGQWNDLDQNNKLYYVVEYSTLLDEEDIIFDSHLKLYPNPSQDHINIHNEIFDFNKIEIYNLIGQSISIRNFNNSNFERLDISSLEAGIYCLKISTKDGAIVNRRIHKN